jgi:hypothetical protein
MPVSLRSARVNRIDREKTANHAVRCAHQHPTGIFAFCAVHCVVFVLKSSLEGEDFSPISARRK